MSHPKNLLLGLLLLSLIGCTAEENKANMKEKASPGLLEDTVRTTIEPHVNAIKKAKALEGKLQKIEENRLKSIEGFEQ